MRYGFRGVFGECCGVDGLQLGLCIAMAGVCLSALDNVFVCLSNSSIYAEHFSSNPPLASAAGQRMYKITLSAFGIR